MVEPTVVSTQASSRPWYGPNIAPARMFCTMTSRGGLAYYTALIRLTHLSPGTGFPVTVRNRLQWETVREVQHG